MKTFADVAKINQFLANNTVRFFFFVEQYFKNKSHKHAHSQHPFSKSPSKRQNLPETKV